MRVAIDAMRFSTRAHCAGLAMISAVAARATPEMASAGLPLPRVLTGNEIPLAPGQFRTLTAHSSECTTSLFAI